MRKDRATKRGGRCRDKPESIRRVTKKDIEATEV